MSDQAFNDWYDRYFDEAIEKYAGLDTTNPKGIAQDAWDAAIEADRKRRDLTDERIKLIWKETRARMGVGGDPVLWFARAIERAHGISAPQPAEPVKMPSALPSGTNYSVEPHGNGYAIYQGRDGLHHGANLAHLTECTPEFSKWIESALNAMSEPASKTGWNNELSSWSDEDFIRIFHERPDLANRLRKMLAEPVKVDAKASVPSNDLAHEIWAAAQTAPGESIEDAVERVATLLACYGQPTQPIVPLEKADPWYEEGSTDVFKHAQRQRR